jgi:hypothetical protein
VSYIFYFSVSAFGLETNWVGTLSAMLYVTMKINQILTSVLTTATLFTGFAGCAVSAEGDQIEQDQAETDSLQARPGRFALASCVNPEPEFGGHLAVSLTLVTKPDGEFYLEQQGTETQWGLNLYVTGSNKNADGSFTLQTAYLIGAATDRFEQDGGAVKRIHINPKNKTVAIRWAFEGENSDPNAEEKVDSYANCKVSNTGLLRNFQQR